MKTVESFLEGRWQSGDTSADAATPLVHAVTGETIGTASTKGLDFAGALSYARRVGGTKLRKLTFHERAICLKKLALYLTDRKEEFYEASKPTGATRSDSWIDIEGGFGTLFVFSSKARRELPAEPFHIDGPVEKLSKGNTFSGQHICLPLEGVALHINAFNFPCWGMLEKFAPTFIAGVPSIIKPATASCFLTQAVVKAIIESKILPEGSLQLICGSVGDTFEHLDCQDVITFTGSQSTGIKLRNHPRVVERSIRFNMESDSLNCSVLGPDAAPGTPEFDLYVKELAKEMTVKAGQKCTVIRRAIIPSSFSDAVVEAVKKRLEKVVVGNPDVDTVRMGALVNREQVADVKEQVEKILTCAEIAAGDLENFTVTGADKERGAFLPPLLLFCKKPLSSPPAHSVEAFGPVSTLMPYDTLEDAIELARMGAGSLVGSLFTADDEVARKVVFGAGAFHGRLLLVNSECAAESTGHGSPLPHLVHGGPGRAGGGEELGGMRSVMHYMQRVALQGSPERLTKVCNSYISGGHLKKSAVHPFRKYYEELEIGETLLTGERLVTKEDVEAFAALGGDHFYAHMDESAAEKSIFGKRVAHGYFVISAAAGLFVDPAPGPVLANYGLENLRFTKPVYFGDTIKVRLTCKQKTPKEAEPPQGIVAWDVEVTNQDNEPVAVYTVLTLVARRTPAAAQ